MQRTFVDRVADSSLTPCQIKPQTQKFPCIAFKLDVQRESNLVKRKSSSSLVVPLEKALTCTHL